MRKDKVTLLIYSCHKFSDLWDAHIKLLNQNWPDRGIRTIILTDEPENRTFPGVEIISAGAGKEITDRIRYVLPLIDTEYVLVSLDDYFPIYPIDGTKIDHLLSVMQNEKYDYIRLFKNPRYKLRPTPDPNIFTYDLNGEYLVNLYVGLWRKDFIEKTLPNESMSAWDFEVSLTAAARKANGNCAVSKGNEFPIMDTVRKGKILRNAYKYLKKHDLYNGSRLVRTRNEAFWLTVRTHCHRTLNRGPHFLSPLVRKVMIIFGMHSFSGKRK